jgi:HopA1 effector protein family
VDEAGRDIPAELPGQLDAVFSAFTILSPVSFSFGREPPVDVRMTPHALGWAGVAQPGWAEPGDPLVKGIQATFYERCYARRLSGPEEQPARASASDPDFARRLAEANLSRERWDKGWVIHGLGTNGQAFVRKGDRERAAIPGAFISEAVVGMAPQIGASVSIRAPRETLDAQPGYYFAFGETLDELADQLSLVRLYFHCGAEVAILLLNRLSRSLNEFQTPFQLKMPTAPALYQRDDTVVLYVGVRYFPIAARIIALARNEISLADPAPLFTKRLWRGVGAAVDPGTGESFGMHRCRLAAEGIVDAWRNGSQDLAARHTAVAARFAAAGLDVARPHLGPSGVDPFDLPQPALLS